MILVLSKILLYFENNGRSSQYKKTTKQNEFNGVCRKNVIHFKKNSWFQLLQTLALALALYL